MKYIQLANSTLKAIIDDADFEIVYKYKWHLNPDSHTNYAQSSIKNAAGIYTTISLHRFILTPNSTETIDHINHNGLDCQRSNMRIVTQKQNTHNSRPHKGRLFKGVYQKGSKYYAAINNKYIGSFDSPIRAALAYNKAALDAWGEYAYLNPIPANHPDVGEALIDDLMGFRTPAWYNLDRSLAIN